MPAPTIQTERLVLRAPALADAAHLTALIGAREVAATTLLIPHPYTIQHAESFINMQEGEVSAGKGINWLVMLKGGGLVGGIGLVLTPAHTRAEVGYWMGVAHWGKGYATEAARAVVRHAFSVLGLERLNAYHYAGNLASGRVLLKAGMRFEGILRGHILKWGQYHDAHWYGICRGDPEAANARF